MFCKYCGTEIANDSVFCAKCGMKIQEDVPSTHKEKCDVDNSIHIQIVGNENDIWRETNNLQWKKPLVARVLQFILVTVGLFFLCYGIVWSCIIEKKVSEDYHPCSYPFFDRFEANAYEPLGIIDVFVDLERDDPDFPIYKSEWESLYTEKYDDKLRLRVFERLCKEWGINISSSNSYDPFCYPYSLDEYRQLSMNQRAQFRRAMEMEEPSRTSIPYDYAKYYLVADQMAVSKFRTLTLFVYIIPALILIVLSIIWIIKTTPKSNIKAILPRDLADKIENYTWNGFTLHRYIRFIKNDKYGILDAVTRCITVPATFDLIEWRLANKSYDGVSDGIRKTYDLITTK